MTAALVSGCVAALAVAGLFAWRWWLDSRAADRTAERTHVEALHAKRVEVDQAAIDGLQGKVRQLEDRLKTLEYRPR